MADRISREHPSAAYLRSAIQSRDLDELVQAVKQWLNDTKNSRWLIVYDNYDNPMLDGDPSRQQRGADADGSGDDAYDIRNLLPETDQGAVIITTRSARVKLGHQIPLGKLRSLEDSLEILSHTSGRQHLHEGK